MRQRKYDMKILNGQKLIAALIEPLLFGTALAAWAVAGLAAIVYGHFALAVVTLVDVTAELARAALEDMTHSFGNMWW